MLSDLQAVSKQLEWNLIYKQDMQNNIAGILCETCTESDGVGSAKHSSLMCCKFSLLSIPSLARVIFAAISERGMLPNEQTLAGTGEYPF